MPNQPPALQAPNPVTANEANLPGGGFYVMDKQSFWREIDTYPATLGDSFWAPDEPLAMAPQAFSPLPPELGIYRSKPNVTGYVLEAALPLAPAELPVYVLGGYPDERQAIMKQMLTRIHPDCDVVPAYSLAFCGPDANPAGAGAPVHTADEAEARVREILGEVYLDDWARHEVIHWDDGDWQVVYTLHVGGIPILMDKPLQAIVNPNGELTYLLGRRRPLMAQSSYPIRTAADAWAQLEAGQGIGLDIIQGARAPQGTDPFVVESVEIAYVVTHANTTQEIMQPYWVFRNEKRQALFVPAVSYP